MTQPPRDQDAKQNRQNLTHRTFVGLFWAFSGSGMQAVLKLVVLGFLARLLTEADFGIVALCITVTAFTDMFAKLGIGLAIVQREEIEERHIRVGFSLTIILSVVFAALLWALSPPIAAFYGEPTLIPLLRVLAFGLLVDGIGGIARSLANRDLNFRLRAGTEAVSYFVGYGLVSIVLGYLNFGPWALIIGIMAQKVISTVTFLFFKPHSKRPQFDRDAAAHLIYYGSGYSLSDILFRGASQGDYIVVGRSLGAAALGTYQKAYQLMVLPAMLFGSALDNVLFPAMSKVQNDKKTIGTVYRRGVAFTALFTLPASVVLFVFAREYVLILLGSQWTGAILPFQILAIGMILRQSSSMSDSLIRAKGAVYNRAWRQGIYAACVIVGAIVGQRWGITGVATGVLTALLINAVLMVQLSLKLTGMSWRVFAQANLQASLLTGVVLAESWVLATSLRGLDLPALLIVLIAGCVIAVSVLALIWFFPKATLGADGIWIVQLIGKYLPKRIGRKLAELHA